MKALHLVFQTLFLSLAPAWRGEIDPEQMLHIIFQYQELNELADSESDCDLGERCIGQSDENLSSWYVWFLMLFCLALLLFCGICCCLQCWLKQRSCLPHQRTLAVFALSSSDTLCASELSQCPFSGSLTPCTTVETSTSSDPQFSLGGTELPPSYEEVMKENNL